MESTILCSYISVAVALMLMFSTSLGDDCRVIEFIDIEDGTALEDHVIATMKATTNDFCEVQCFIENGCVSYNFGPSVTGDGSICELNNSTNQKYLKPRTLYTYRGTKNACQSNPCLNNATCQSGFTEKEFRCLCLAGFQGELCATGGVNKCDGNPCMNGGACSDLVDGYKCICHPGYTGNQCETDVTECASNPCLNEGTCSDLFHGYNCTWQPGYNGSQCEIDVNECSSNPCLNGGFCTNLVDGYRCACPQEFIGNHCETVLNECTSNPCMNGECKTDPVDGYKCLCHPEYTGNQCEIDMKDCQSNPCLSRENCTDLPNGYKCTCQPGFNGSQCETVVNRTDPTGKGDWITFWWFAANTTRPLHETDVLAYEFGHCMPQDPYCFGRIPAQAREDSTDLLAIDSLGSEYQWSFSSKNVTAHAVWRAFHDHKIVFYGEADNADKWNPVVLKGKAPIEHQDSFMYREQNGVKSVILDDDSCDCFSSLQFGHGLCRNGHDPRHSPRNQFGAEELYDHQCTAPRPGIGLVLYFRSNKK